MAAICVFYFSSHMLPDRLSKGEEVFPLHTSKLCFREFLSVRNAECFSPSDFLFLLQFFEAHRLREVLCCQETEVTPTSLSLALFLVVRDLSSLWHISVDLCHFSGGKTPTSKTVTSLWRTSAGWVRPPALKRDGCPWTLETGRSP